MPIETQNTNSRPLEISELLEISSLINPFNILRINPNQSREISIEQVLNRAENARAGANMQKSTLGDKYDLIADKINWAAKQIRDSGSDKFEAFRDAARYTQDTSPDYRKSSRQLLEWDIAVETDKTGQYSSTEMAIENIATGILANMKTEADFRSVYNMPILVNRPIQETRAFKYFFLHNYLAPTIAALQTFDEFYDFFYSEIIHIGYGYDTPIFYEYFLKSPAKAQGKKNFREKYKSLIDMVNEKFPNINIK
jgi:hypothetical protein